MLGIPLYTQMQRKIRSSEFSQRTKITDAVDYAKKSKIRWAGHVMQYAMAINLITLARDRDEWRRYRRPLEEVDDQGKGTTGDTGDSRSIRKAFTTVYDDCLFYFD
uniref:Transposase n=1 Tax=Haemonchus contortus TaxID=6289 RepID=A0A7I5EED0_HAECO